MNRRLRLLAIVCLVVGACTDSESAGSPPAPVPDGTQPPARTAATETGSWRRIPPMPGPAASGMATAWTGKLLVAWGGELDAGERRASGAGAAYDPRTDRWQPLPPAPVAGRTGSGTVWTGAEVLIWGGQTGDGTTLADGAAYNPATRKWRMLPVAPIGARSGPEAVWTGREMLVWGGFERCCPIDSVIHDQAAAAFDPAANQWRLIAPVPPPWSGDDGGAVTAAAAGRIFIWREGRLAVLSDAADSWNEVRGAPAPPELDPDKPVSATTADPQTVGTAAGDEIFVWSGFTGQLAGAAFRAGSAAGDASGEPRADQPPSGGARREQPPPGGTWRRTATLDAQAGAAAAAGADRIFAAAGRSSVILEYRIADDRWHELPPAPVAIRSLATLVWTGSELLFWGGIGEEGPEMDGARWHCC